MAPSRRQASCSAPSSSNPVPPLPFQGPREGPPQSMAPDELERQQQRMWMARAKRIDDVVSCWMKCMQELKEKDAIARENLGFQVDVSTYNRGLRNVADIIFSEATDAERTGMPTRSRPELVLKWAMQEVESSIPTQRARWGCVVGIMPPRIPPPPDSSAPPSTATLPST